MSLDTKEFALKAVRLLNEKKAVDVILLEIGPISVIADYFLICHGNSKIQTKALSDHILESLPDEEYSLLRMEGYRDASWILVDFGTLVIHIFIPEERSFYNLERLWGGARVIDLQYLSAAP
ncbi:MAG: ribosome silencing factor [Bacillota bacterium]|nr:ribosome silencing factor [Bacillota bacterium]